MSNKKGILYGVGVGPGNPELMTLQAVRILTHCPVIAVPKTKDGNTMALDIIKENVPLDNKLILQLYFSMSRDASIMNEAHLKTADAIENYLNKGQDVAMPNIGDVSVFSSYRYIQDILTERGHTCVMVPGITSFCACASTLGISLTEMDKPLHIIPAGGVDLIRELSNPGTKVLMKSAKAIHSVLDTLKETGDIEHASMVVDCGLPTEKVVTDLRTLDKLPGYFATIIVPDKNR